jgi:hypothetical protein
MRGAWMRLRGAGHCTFTPLKGDASHTQDKSLEHRYLNYDDTSELGGIPGT